jgi:hypothetical protein
VPPPWFSPPHLHRARSSNPRESRKGLFAHPPSAKLFKTTGEALLRDLMAIQVPLTLNVAFCERHRKVCPPSDELERECGKVSAAEQRGGCLGRRAEGQWWRAHCTHDLDARGGLPQYPGVSATVFVQSNTKVCSNRQPCLPSRPSG